MSNIIYNLTVSTTLKDTGHNSYSKEDIIFAAGNEYDIRSDFIASSVTVTVGSATCPMSRYGNGPII